MSKNKKQQQKRKLSLDFNRDFAEKRKLQTDNLGGQASSKSLLTTDSYSNLTARLGIQANQIGSHGASMSYYSLGPYITRNRIELEAAYRENWLVGKIIDCIAEDMTREGINMNSEMKPDNVQKLQSAISKLRIWSDLASTLKWARLYGGALAVMLIDGADYSKPLNIEAIGKGRFKGLKVLDRWMIQPSMGDLITDLGKNMGMPKYYEVIGAMSSFPSMKIHYTRVLRFDGIELPYYQKVFENLWGLSVIERMLDRLIAFDSATQGAAQLMYKAYLRVIGIEGLREALAAGGPTEDAVIRQFMYIRALQTNEGITLLDAKDQFNTHQYTFSGISDVLQQFGQQISGAEGIPLVRLFGQSPAGLSSTGESDLRNYYDEILKRQENDIRPEIDRLLEVMSMSELGGPLPEDFEYEFVSLWQMSEREKAEIASADSTTITNVINAGLMTKKQGLMELRQVSRVTGRFTNITEEDIEEADDELPPSPAAPEGGTPSASGESSSEEKGKVASIAPHQTEKMEKEMKQSKEEPINERKKENREALESRDRFSFRDIWTNFKRKRKLILDEFKESEHPRGKGEKGGQFVSKGEEGTSSAVKEKKIEKSKAGAKPKAGKWEMKMSKIVNGKRVSADGKPLPPHIAKLPIPPAWKDLEYSADPKQELQVRAKDNQNHPQYIYTPEHWEKADQKKFGIVGELNKKFKDIEKEISTHDNEEAKLLKLIMQTGIRPGSEKDLNAKQKAYGATTLLGKHVKKTKEGLLLDFIGKDGVHNQISVTDKSLVKDISNRVSKAGSNGKLFNTNDKVLRKYSKKLDGGGFRPKDFRTLLGTKTAMDAIKGLPPPPPVEEKKAYQKAVMEIAKIVANKLGNTPKVALKSYISPTVWEQWRKS